MGAGLAKAFKERYPRLFHQYATDCMAGLYKPGRVFCYYTEDVEYGVRIIACFPTKTTWRAPSRIEHIADGMRDLFRMMLIHNEHMQRSVSVALPKLGCGLGGRLRGRGRRTKLLRRGGAQRCQEIRRQVDLVRAQLPAILDVADAIPGGVLVTDPLRLARGDLPAALALPVPALRLDVRDEGYARRRQPRGEVSEARLLAVQEHEVVVRDLDPLPAHLDLAVDVVDRPIIFGDVKIYAGDLNGGEARGESQLGDSPMTLRGFVVCAVFKATIVDLILHPRRCFNVVEHAQHAQARRGCCRRLRRRHAGEPERSSNCVMMGSDHLLVVGVADEGLRCRAALRGGFATESQGYTKPIARPKRSAVAVVFLGEQSIASACSTMRPSASMKILHVKALL